MKIKGYGEIQFDGHQVVVKGWRLEMKGKQLPMTDIFARICKELSKNPDIRWIFEANEFL